MNNFFLIYPNALRVLSYKNHYEYYDETQGIISFNHSLVEGSLINGAWNPLLGINQGGNIDADPLFVYFPLSIQEEGNFRLSSGSPAINAGDNACPRYYLDLDGNSRVYNDVVDMGAYEHEINRLYVDQACQNSVHNGFSWGTAYTKLEDALNYVRNHNVPSMEIWVAMGTYQPVQDSSFHMVNGVGIYGGFKGWEPERSYARPEQYVTILKGNGSSVISNHFTENTKLDSTAILDGFTIMDGGGSNHPPGGGISNYCASPIIQNCTIINCHASYGGGIYNKNSYTIVRNCFIKNCYAFDGGGIYNGGYFGIGSSFISIYDSKIESCTAGSGGGIYNLNYFGVGSSSISIYNSKIESCIAQVDGGGIYNGTSAYLIDDAPSIFMYNSEIKSCIAQDNGGGILCKLGVILIENCCINSNQAMIGGGVCSGSYARMAVTNSILKENIASYIGGGIYSVMLDTLILKNTLVNNNYTSGLGGGIYIDEGSYARMSNITVTQNHSEKKGGGITYHVAYNYDACNKMILDNTSDVTYDNDFTFGICNSIIWGNTSNTQEKRLDNIYCYQHETVNDSRQEVEMEGAILFNHSLVEGSFYNSIWHSGVGVDGGGNIDENPMFVNPLDNDFNLTYNSPVINMGDNACNTISFMDDLTATGLMYDLSGNPRIKNDIIDMGAYEYQGYYRKKRLYVNQANASLNGTKDGLSWETAYDKLETALTEAITLPNSVKEIWVASGIYRPTVSRTSYKMAESTKIYGGFLGNETTISQRNYEKNLTILEGNGAGVPVISNIYNVQSPLSNIAVLDGFTITKGQAGGIQNTYASPILRNLIICNNTNGVGGGGISNSNSSPILENVTIIGNQSTIGGGGMDNNINSSPVLTNVLISGNKTNADGGAMRNQNSSHPAMTNVTISGNYANRGGGIANISASGSSPVLKNCILWGNKANTYANVYNLNVNSRPTYTYSLVEGSKGGWTTLGVNLGYNIDTIPWFRHYKPANPDTTTKGDYRLLHDSPAIDAGNTSFNMLSIDLEGKQRVYNGTIDMGAYEWNGEKLRLYVKKDNTNAIINGFTWETAYPEFSNALDYANNCDYVSEVWVAQGSYQPTQSSSFKMLQNIPIYGGFQGNEEDFTARNWEIYKTILQGNASSVIKNDFTETNPLTSNALLDGFIIKNGTGSLFEPYQAFTGGGIYNEHASPTIRYCIIENCEADDGGGIFNYHSSPIIQYTTIQNNSALMYYGGGVYSTEESFPQFSNVAIRQNTSEYDGGGAYNDSFNGDGASIFVNSCIIGNQAMGVAGGTYSSCNTSYINVEITGNYTYGYGGGLYHDNGTCMLENVTMSGNYAPYAGGLILAGGDMSILNSIIWGNGDYTESNAEIWSPSYIQASLIGGCGGSDAWNPNFGGIDLSGNLDEDPQFVDYQIDFTGASVAGDFHLQSNSPAIDAGINTNEEPFDLDGNPRIQNENIDMGAYEFQFAKSIIASDAQDEAENPEEELTEAVNTAQLSVKVYPNPVKVGNQVMVEIPVTDEDVATQLEVYNILGVQVGKYTVNSTTTSISLPNAKGQYFIKIMGKEGFMQVKKVIVM